MILSPDLKESRLIYKQIKNNGNQVGKNKTNGS